MHKTFSKTIYHSWIKNNCILIMTKATIQSHLWIAAGLLFLCTAGFKALCHKILGGSFGAWFTVCQMLLIVFRCCSDLHFHPGREALTRDARLTPPFPAPLKNRLPLFALQKASLAPPCPAPQKLTKPAGRSGAKLTVNSKIKI